MTTEPREAPRCSICKDIEFRLDGTRTHEGRAHAFTTVPGDLRTPPPPAQSSTAMLLRSLGAGPEPVAIKVLQLLLNKGVVDEREVLGCLGIQAPTEPARPSEGS